MWCSGIRSDSLPLKTVDGNFALLLSCIKGDPENLIGPNGAKHGYIPRHPCIARGHTADAETSDRLEMMLIDLSNLQILCLCMHPDVCSTQACRSAMYSVYNYNARADTGTWHLGAAGMPSRLSGRLPVLFVSVYCPWMKLINKILLEGKYTLQANMAGGTCRQLVEAQVACRSAYRRQQQLAA